MALTHYTMYGLRVLADASIPGLTPVAAGTEWDLCLQFGPLPQWTAVGLQDSETRFTSSYLDEHGLPGLMVRRTRDGGFFHFAYSDGTQFLIDEFGTRVHASWPNDQTLEDMTTYLLGPIMGFVLLLRGVTSLHASAVVIDGRSIVLVGPSGSGKSTTAAAFARLGYPVLAEDVVALADEGDHFRAQPGYPRIRLWPASVRILYGDEADLPLLTPNWDKRYLDLTSDGLYFQQQALSLGGIYLISNRSDSPESPHVKPIPRRDRLMALVANTCMSCFMTAADRAREFALLGRVAGCVPVRRVTPHQDPAKLTRLCQTIRDDFKFLTASTGLEREYRQGNAE